MSAVTLSRTVSIKAERQALAASVADVAAIIPSKSPKEGLAMMLVRAEDGGVLKLAGSNGGSWVEADVDRVDVESAGAFLINGQQFARVVAEIVSIPGDAPVFIEADPTTGAVKVKVPKTPTAPGAVFNLRANVVDDFPPVPPAPDAPETVGLTGSDLSGMIRLVRFAAHPEKSRHLMNCVTFTKQGDNLRVFATDGKRLSIFERAATGLPDFGLIGIPLDAIDIVDRMARSDTGSWSVWATSADGIQFRGPRGRVVCRPLEGLPPPVQDIVVAFSDQAKTGCYPITFDRDGLIGAAKMAAVLTTEKATSIAVKLILAADGGRHAARVQDPEVGDSDVDVAIDWQGPATTVSFTPTILLESLKVLPKGPVAGHLFTGKNSPPFVVSARSPEKGTWHFLVVMPLNTPGA